MTEPDAPRAPIPATEPARVRAEGFGFAYAAAGRPALQDVSFELDPGECLLVVGPSGSGKSTLALAAAGLVPREIPGEVMGRIEVDGTDPAAAGPGLRGRVGVVFQDPDRQLVMERVEDDVAFGLENMGWPHEAMVDRVPEALGEVGLAGFQRRRPHGLSGGEQQRLALAGVLAPHPGLLVLDEPSANLDPTGTRGLFERLARLRDRGRTTMLLVEHRPAAWGLATLVLALGRDGRPIDLGPPEDVLRRSGPALVEAGIWLPSDEPPDAEEAGQRPNGDGRIALPLAEAYDIWFEYDRGRPVLRNVDLAVTAGERIAITGPNGSGKSTLGRVLVGLHRPRRGVIRLLGRRPSRMRPAELARIAGYVFQDPERQFLAATVEGEIRLGLRRGEQDGVPELMERLHLPLGRFGTRSPYTLSGGEQRRLSLACVLVRRPRLLVLDEPTFGQDRRGYEGLLAILRSRLDDGAALVVATHDERLVADVAARRVVMGNGRVISDGPVALARSFPPLGATVES